MSLVIYVKESKDSAWIAQAIAGAFHRALVFDHREFEPGAITSLLPQIVEQGISVVVSVQDYEELMKKFEGIIVLAEGEEYDEQYKEKVIRHEPEGKQGERDIVVEKVLAELRKRKLLKPL